MSRAVIISGGNISDDFALEFLRKYPADFFIAADRGIQFFRRQRLFPTHIVGDFDSGSQEDLKWFQEQEGIEIRRFRPQKDFTDTQIAVELALELGAKQIYILGGTGTRIDHILANIRVLSLCADQGIDCFLEDENNRIYQKKEGFTIEKKEQFGTYISLFALGGPVTDLTLKGFFYPLDHYCMEGMDPVGVSNEITEAAGNVEFSSGTLLVVESKD